MADGFRGVCRIPAQGLALIPLSDSVAAGLTGAVLPSADPVAPWSLVESNPNCCNPCCAGSGSTCTLCASQCDPTQTLCTVPTGANFVVTTSGTPAPGVVDNGTTYARSEAKAVGAAHLSITAQVAVQPDNNVPANPACPTLPAATATVVASDGTASALLAIGQTTSSRGVVSNYIALRSIVACSPALAQATVAIDITQPHTYTVQLNAGSSAKVFVDGSTTASLTVPYARLDAAAFLHGANFAFRTERGVTTWNYVNYSIVGSPVGTNVLADEYVPDDCSGGRCAGNHAPDCSALAADLAELPVDRQHHAVGVRGARDADGDALAVYIDGISSDEDEDNDDEGPDGVYVARDRVALCGRIHDDGDDDRTYELHVHVRDHRGGSCDGTVRVCVPRAHGHACHDRGWRFRSDHHDWDDDHGYGWGHERDDH